MTKYSALSCIIAMAATLFGGLVTSCNTSYDENEYTLKYSSTSITGFSLSANDNILDNLDSVFFCIDLVKGEIYNASPLPYGTDISRMVVNIESDACSETEIAFKTVNGTDTTVNYLTNATDSINFANGPITVHVASYDMTARRNYKVWVNVYDEPVDSMYWSKMTRGVLPSTLSAPTSQKTTETSGKYYILTSKSGRYSISVTSTPSDESTWESREVDFGGITPDVASFTGTPDGKLYVIAGDNTLYASDDEGDSWTSCGDVKMNYIYGAYGNSVLGSVVVDDKTYSLRYPGGTELVSVPDGFPVSGTSELVNITTEWEVNPQGYLIGGRKANGELSGDTWGYDGRNWACVSSGTLEEAEYRTLFPYVFCETDSTSWRRTERDVLVSIGGRKQDGTIITDVHYSNDMGLHWFKAHQLQQLPSTMVPRYGASAVVVNETLNARAIKPITEWEAPYVYLVGGYDIYGQLQRDIWRGVIDYLTIKPLQ